MAKSEIEQLTLLDVDEDWRELWRGMPEFVQEDKEPYQKITMNFSSREDVQNFGKLIGQSITSKTDSLWFPKQANYVAPKNFRYVDES